MTQKQKFLTKTISLIAAFIVLATIFAFVEKSQFIKIENHFNATARAVFFENDDSKIKNINLSDLTSNCKNFLVYQSIALSCKKDVDFNKLSLNISAAAEEIIEIKIKKDLEASSYITKKTILTKPNKNLIIDIEADFNFVEGETLYLEILGLQNIAITGLKLSD